MHQSIHAVPPTHTAVHAVPHGYRDATMTYAQLVTNAAQAPVTMDRSEYRAILADAGRTEDELQADVDALAARNRGSAALADSQPCDPEAEADYVRLVEATADWVHSDSPLPITEEEAAAILATAGRDYDDFGRDLQTLMDLQHQSEVAEMKRQVMFDNARRAAAGASRLEAMGY